MARARSWPEFQARITSVYLVVSAVGIVLTIGLMLLLGRYMASEQRLLVLAATPAIAVASVGQFWWHHRWLRGTRRWFRGDDEPGLQDRVYLELIRFPWLGSLLNFGFWMGVTIVVVLAWLIWLPEMPVYRKMLVLLASGATALVAWSLQYFVFRRIVFRVLEMLDISDESVAAVRRQPIVRKYVGMFGMMVLGAVLFGCTLAYGLNRNVVRDSYFRTIQDVLMAAELLVYEYDFGDAIDVQSKLDAMSARTPGKLRIVPRMSAGAIAIDQAFAKPDRLLGFASYQQEQQAIPAQLVVARSLAFGANRASSTFLEYAVDTAPLMDRIRLGLWKITATGLLLTLLMFASTWMFLDDLTRPIRLIRRGLHPTGDAFTPPPLIVADDEQLAFSVGVQSMFVRLRALFQDLLRAYWDVKDERGRIQEVAIRFQQRTQRDGVQINVVTNRLRELVDHVQDLGQQLEAMSTVSETISQATRMMRDTIDNMQNEMAHIRTRVRDARDWSHTTGEDLGSTKRTMAGLDRWVSEASQDFELILRKFQDLVLALEPVDVALGHFDERVQTGTEHVQTIYMLLSSETDRYSAGITLIEQAQDRLDEVMLQFQQVEAIREQIEMLSFQAAVVASQSMSFERDFRVVADEIRDLSERAGTGIQRIFTAIWTLDQQGKQTLQRILNSRHALNESLEVSRRAHQEASKGAEFSGSFVTEMHEVVQIIRDEALRTDKLVDSLSDPFTKGAQLRGHIGAIDDTFQLVGVQIQKLDELSRGMELQIHEQQEGLRVSGSAVERIGMNIRELISAGEGVIMQSRTLRSILERLVHESEQSGSRIRETLDDLQRIEDEVFRNEAEIKRISAELQKS